MNRCPSGEFCPVCERFALIAARARVALPPEPPSLPRLGMWARLRSWLRYRPTAWPLARQVPR